MSGARSAGRIDGLRSAHLRICDPRKSFAARADLAESDWPGYRTAYVVAYSETRLLWTYATQRRSQ